MYVCMYSKTNTIYTNSDILNKKIELFISLVVCVCVRARGCACWPMYVCMYSKTNTIYTNSDILNKKIKLYKLSCVCVCVCVCVRACACGLCMYVCIQRQTLYIQTVTS